MTTVAFRPLTTAEQIFKDLVWDPGIAAGELALETAVPLLDVPILKQLDEEAIKLLTDWLFNRWVLVVDIASIHLVDAVKQSAYDSASLNLKVIAHDKGISSDEYSKARDAVLADQSRFTRFGSQ